MAVYSASFVISLARFQEPHYYIIRQAIWAGLGGVLMVTAIRTDYRRYEAFAVPIMLATIAALVAVLAIGVSGGGARRWIGVGEFTVQPAEFAKLTVIIYLAAWLEGKGDSIRSFEHGLAPFVLIISSVAVLIILEPNLGTTIIMLLITVTMFWVAGASFLQMCALGVSGFLAILALATVQGYRLERMTAYFDAEGDPLGNGFQTLQALIAMGNGGISGLGLGASRAKFFYLPESHTDGVFAILGEELGIIATLTVIVLFMALMVRGFQVARRSRDEFGKLVATGITTWLVIQALLNMGGITRVIPLTGVPLPFLSYGGNALAAELLAVGVLVSVSRFGSDRGGYTDRDRRAAPRRRIVRRQQQ